MMFPSNFSKFSTIVDRNLLRFLRMVIVLPIRGNPFQVISFRSGRLLVPMARLGYLMSKRTKDRRANQPAFWDCVLGPCWILFLRRRKSDAITEDMVCVYVRGYMWYVNVVIA